MKLYNFPSPARLNAASRMPWRDEVDRRVYRWQGRHQRRFLAMSALYFGAALLVAVVAEWLARR